MSTQSTTDTVREALAATREAFEPVIDLAVERATDAARDAREQMAPRVAVALHTAADRLIPDDDTTRMGAVAAAAAGRLDRTATQLQPRRARWPWFLLGILAALGLGALVARARRRSGMVLEDDAYAERFPRDLPADTDPNPAQAKIDASIANAKHSVAEAAAADHMD